MDQQESIFDEAFYAEIPVRRRKVVPIAVNIYAWATMILGGILTLKICYGVWGPLPADIENFAEVRNDPAVVISTLLPGTMLFLMGFLVWMEAKQAIKFNWVVAGLFCLILLACLSFGIAAFIGAAIFTALFIPYWIMLFINRHKWAQAVRGKQC